MHFFHTRKWQVSLILVIALVAYAVPGQAKYLPKGSIIEADWTPVIIIGAMVVVAIVFYVVVSRLDDPPAVESDDTESVMRFIGSRTPRCIEANRLGGFMSGDGRIIGPTAKSLAIQTTSERVPLKHSSIKWLKGQEPLAAQSSRIRYRRLFRVTNVETERIRLPLPEAGE